MEFIPDQCLDDRTYLQDGRLFASFKPTIALRILRDISSALCYIHDKHRILHDDVKPANILYSGERGACLIDMGSADSVEKPGIGGTCYYTALEIYVLGRIEVPLISKEWPFWEVFNLKRDSPSVNYRTAYGHAKKWQEFIQSKATEILREEQKSSEGDEKLRWALLKCTARMLGSKYDRPRASQVLEQAKKLDQRPQGLLSS
ncbi:hypothetical protein M434DRAFT_397808 [Hypoxylon sp. CO27-5]|nr:hypothetical protein M434DRAFT_397808 [Hypoxylon sp. CO27-5]